MALKTRKPTGLAPWPLLVIEGMEKTGKSYSTVLLSQDQRIGQMFWFDIGEGAADQYGIIDGVRYEVVEHDGSYRDLRTQVLELVATVPGVDAQGRPNVAVIDSATNPWTMLKDEAVKIAENRAAERARKYNRAVPDEISVTMDLWNRAATRWRAIVDPLIQWPGLVVFTARGKEVADVDDAGKPIPNTKKHTFESHKTLEFDADVIVRTMSPGVFRLTGARSAFDLRGALEVDVATSLSSLLFDTLRLGGQMGVRDLRVAEADTSDGGVAELVAEVLTAIAQATALDGLKALWDSNAEALKADADAFNQVAQAVKARKSELEQQATVPTQRKTSDAEAEAEQIVEGLYATAGKEA